MSRSTKELLRIADRLGHVCSWPQCTIIVPPTLVLCRMHWRELPASFRDRLQDRYRGAGNCAHARDAIMEQIQMFKNTSDNAQDRTRRTAENTTRNLHGIDAQVFKDAPGDALAGRKQTLTIQLGDTQLKLARVKAIIEEAHLRSGTWSSRSVPPETMARWVQEKRLLLGEIQAIQIELTKIKLEMGQRQAAGRKEEEKDFVTTFHALAKEVLAGPVYDRVATATIHRMKERESN